MKERALFADIGNTHVKIAFSDADGLGESFVLPTKAPHTVDSLGLALLQLAGRAGLRPEDFEGGLICSVVPDTAFLFKRACEKYLTFSPLSFPEDISADLENRYERPQEVGADRLLAAYAARKIFPEPTSLIVIDFGTATTFDCVSEKAYLGGLICPGLFSSRDALAAGTAKLPRISLEMVGSVLDVGRNTAASMSQGFLFGFAAMAEGLCLRLKHSLPPPVFVVGTGGVARGLSNICSAFDVVRPELLLEGMRILWKERRGKDGFEAKKDS